MAAVWEFLKRHKGKIIVGGVAVGSAVALAIHSQKDKEDSFSPPILENEYLRAQARKHYVFDTNHRSGDQSIIDVAPSLKQLVQSRFDVDSLIRRIQTQGDLSKSEKLEIWQHIKISSISRIISLAFSYSVLTLTFKAQISILAAELCAQFEQPKKEGIISNFLPSSFSSIFASSQLSEPPQKGIDAKSRQIFLQCIHFFTTNGILHLFDIVEEAVVNEVNDISLSQDFTREDMIKILDSVVKRFEQPFSDSLCDMIAPISKEDASSTDGVMKLLSRLLNVLKSKWTSQTLTDLSTFYFDGACKKLSDDPTPLARVLPRFADSFDVVASTAFDGPLQSSLCSAEIHSFSMKVFKMLE